MLPSNFLQSEFLENGLNIDGQMFKLEKKGT